MQDDNNPEQIEVNPETEVPQKLNRKQRRALNSKRGGDSVGTGKTGSDNHKNRIEEKPKARRR